MKHKDVTKGTLVFIKGRFNEIEIIIKNDQSKKYVKTFNVNLKTNKIAFESGSYQNETAFPECCVLYKNGEKIQ